jgi:hypothetical protein
MKNALERGRTYYGTSGTIDASTDYGGIELEGMPVAFKDTDTTDPTIIQSGRLVRGRIMRNVSGFTIPGGIMVSHKTAYRGRRFCGRTCVTALEAAGVVDPRLGTTGCRDGDLCIVFTKGPCDVYVADSVAATIVAADLAYAITGATSAATTDSGKVEAVAATSAITLYAVNAVGRFEAAGVSATVANTLVLVDLCIE